MSYNKAFEKKSVETQVLTLNALERIEMLSNNTNAAVNGIFLDVSTKISKVQYDIKNELEKQTSILQSISSKIDKYSSSKPEVEKSELTKIIALSGNDNAKGLIGNVAFAIATLGVAFYAFGKGLGQMTNISPEQAVAVGISTFAIFAGLSMIFREGVEVSLVDAFKMALVLPVIGYSIVTMAEQFAKIPNIPMSSIGIALVLSASLFPIAYAISKAFQETKNSGLASIFSGLALVGAIFLGELLIFPVLGRMIAMTATEFSKIVPLSPMQLVTAIGVAATIAPIAYFTGKIVQTLFGGGLLGLIGGILKAPFAIGATLGALAIIPLMAHSITWSATILARIPAVSPQQLITALLTAAALAPIMYSFVKIFEAVRGPVGFQALLGDIGSKISGIDGTDGVTEALAQAGMAIAIIPLLALVTVAAAFILAMMPTNISMKQIALVAIIGLAIVPAAIAFAALMAVMRFAGKNIVKGVFVAGLGMVIMAGAMVAIAHIFEYLPDTYKSPPLTWLLKVGFGMIAFSISLSMMAIAAKIAGPVGFALGLLGFTVSALAVLAIAKIFEYLPDEIPEGPDLLWILKVGVGLGMVAGIIALVGAIVGLAGGGMGFGIGVLALLGTALTIVGIAHILSWAPKDAFGPNSLFYSLADTMEYFAIKVVDVFLYLLNGFIPIAKDVVSIFSMIADVFSKVVDILVGAVVRLGEAFMNNLTGIGSFLKELASIGAVELGAIGLSLIAVAGGITAVMLATVSGSIGTLASKGIELLSNGVSAVGKAMFGKKSETGSVMETILTLANNHKPIMHAGRAIKLIADSMKAFSTKNDLNIIGMLYEGISGFFVKSKKGELTQKENLFTYLIDPIDNFQDTLKTLYKHEKPLEKFANSLGKLNHELVGFKDATSSFDLEKLNATNILIQSLTGFAATSQGSSIKAFGKLAQSVTDQAADLYNKVFTTNDTENKNASPTDRNTNQNFASAILQLNLQLGELTDTMDKILKELQGTLQVSVTGSGIVGDNE